MAGLSSFGRNRQAAFPPIGFDPYRKRSYAVSDDEMAKSILEARLSLQLLIDRAEEENGLEVKVEWDGKTLDVEPFKRWAQ